MSLRNIVVVTLSKTNTYCEQDTAICMWKNVISLSHPIPTYLHCIPVSISTGPPSNSLLFSITRLNKRQKFHHNTYSQSHTRQHSQYALNLNSLNSYSYLTQHKIQEQENSEINQSQSLRFFCFDCCLVFLRRFGPAQNILIKKDIIYTYEISL